MKKTQPYYRSGRLIFWVTFLTASIIFGLYFFTGNIIYALYGYFFFLFAVPVNSIIFIILIVKSIKANQSRKINQDLVLMLLNIPVAVFYFWVGVYFTSVMRITIENATGNDIKNVEMIGCENEELNILKNGESKTVWIDINGDCSISMSYTDVIGKIHNETVVGYVTSGMGKKITYNVGN